MEQADLRRLENQCIQEETPQCAAACPLHVDARQFCGLMGQRRFDKAWAVLAKTLPLPGVLARLCDGPCKAACVRKDAGGAIDVDGLERFCADHAQPVRPPLPLPAKGKSVAVVGGTMTGLAAAWEMARRGYAVTLVCAVPGASLPDLPDGVLERELESLAKLGVVTRSEPTATPQLIDALLAEKDAVFVDTDDPCCKGLDLGRPDELTLGTTRPGLFASRAGEPSSVFQAAAGRRAANSIERFTQGVSMVLGRDLEGPYPTRLFTSLDKVEAAPPIVVDSEEAARDEGRRCLQCECMECVKGCEYLKHYKYYPKVYARQIYNNESIVMGTRQANRMINSCMLCGQCETLCPEDFSMAELCLEARRNMVRRGHMPVSAHEFALRDMGFADGGHCALTRHAPGMAHSEYVFFPGCQLPASDPDAVEAAYADLRDRLGAVGLMLRCCGAPAHWAGREPLAAQSLAGLKAEWESLGSPRIIAGCPTCLKRLKEHLPEAETLSYWSVLRALGLPGGAAVEDRPLAVNDPCAARHDPVLQEDVRFLLDQLGAAVTEPEWTGDLTQCCGYGGLLSAVNPELGEAAARRRGQGVEQDLVSYCAMCRDMIARTGKRSLHLFDLLYPGQGDPAARPAPGHSDRRENRARLKQRLVRDLWNDDSTGAIEPFETIEVAFTEAAAATLEQRRILKSDVQKVLLQARASGRRFVHGETGHFLASLRPVAVTYWVEFEEQGDGYLVHNAWHHRMQILGGQP